MVFLKKKYDSIEIGGIKGTGHFFKKETHGMWIWYGSQGAIICQDNSILGLKIGYARTHRGQLIVKNGKNFGEEIVWNRK